MSKKKGILFLCQYFYPEYISSATLPFDTAKALCNAGLKVDTLTGYPREYNTLKDIPIVENHKGINIRRLKYIQLKRSSIVGRLINYFSFTFSVALNFFKLRNYRAIIVYSNPPILPFIAAMAKKMFGVKFIFVSYDIYPEIAYKTNTVSEDSIISKVMNYINKSVYKHVDKVVALSNEMKDYLLTNRPLSEEQVEVIPNWYKDKGTNDNLPQVENKDLNTIKKEGDLIVSYFGNMGISQDIETIVNSIRKLKDHSNIKFLFAGHGNKKDWLKKIVKDENLKNVKIFDFLHGDDFQYALGISDCFIVSLAENLTGLAVPSKTYSYMMAGKPVISIMGKNSDIARDLEKNQAGFSIESRDDEKLVNSIHQLYNNPEKRMKMGSNCRGVFLKNYTEEHCTGKYVNMMRSILGEEKNV